MKYVFLLLLFYSVLHLSYQWPDSFEMEREGKKRTKLTDKISKTSECNKSVPSQFATKHTVYPKWTWYAAEVVDQQERAPKRWCEEGVLAYYQSPIDFAYLLHC